jgi:hypothetical protein
MVTASFRNRLAGPGRNPPSRRTGTAWVAAVRALSAAGPVTGGLVTTGRGDPHPGCGEHHRAGGDPDTDLRSAWLVWGRCAGVAAGRHRMKDIGLQRNSHQIAGNGARSRGASYCLARGPRRSGSVVATERCFRGRRPESSALTLRACCIDSDFCDDRGWRSENRALVCRAPRIELWNPPDSDRGRWRHRRRD